MANSAANVPIAGIFSKMGALQKGYSVARGNRTILAVRRFQNMGASAQLRDHEEVFNPALLMAGVDVCPEGIAVVESGRILYANRAFGKPCEVAAASEMRGRLLTDLLPPGTRYLDSGDTHLSRAGNPVQIEASISHFQKNERALQMVCIRPVQSNRSDGMSPNPQKWESQRMEAIGRLSAEVAHDFKNLLTGILLYSDLLIAGLKPGSRLHRHADAIHRAGADGVLLVQQLTVPSREEEIAAQPLSWNHVIYEMQTLLTRLAGKDIEIRTELAEPLGHVKMEQAQVRQIILNLVLNARDAMPSGGTITLSTRNSSCNFASSINVSSSPVPCVEFTVNDTGTGMDREVLAKAFRPFFTTKTRSHGTGLGLSTVRRNVVQAGGDVEIRSELGRGSQVIVRIPRIPISQEAN